MTEKEMMDHIIKKYGMEDKRTIKFVKVVELCSCEEIKKLFDKWK